VWSCECFEDNDLLSEPCMADVQKKLKKVRCTVNQFKVARTRMKVGVVVKCSSTYQLEVILPLF